MKHRCLHLIKLLTPFYCLVMNEGRLSFIISIKVKTLISFASLYDVFNLSSAIISLILINLEQTVKVTDWFNRKNEKSFELIKHF